MNIIFMGTPSFAVPSLEKLIHSPHNISAVVTTPDKPRGRGLKLAESEVKKIAGENRLKILQPASLKDENFINEIRILVPDLIFVVAFRILPREVFIIPRFGSINLHASLLPKYRGAAPINWAIIKGEKETGVTTFFLEEKVDTGNIILQNKCEITDDDDAGSLHEKLALLGAETVLSTVKLIESSSGTPPVNKQDNILASPAPKITPEICKINWNDTAQNVYNFIRGLSPYPGAYTHHRGNRLKIYKSKISTENISGQTSPGQIMSNDNNLYVCCADGFLEILELQLEGKKRLPGREFIRGHKFETNEKFE